MQWIRRHRRGRPPHPDVLTPAEWRVLDQVREGRTNAEIAVRMGVSQNTVRTHLTSIYAKTGIADRRTLARWDGQPAETSRAEHRPGLAPPFAGWWPTAVVKLTAGGLAAGAFLGTVLLALTMLADVDQDAVKGVVSGRSGVPGMYLEAIVEFERTTFTQSLPYRPGTTTFPVTVRWWWTDDGRSRIEVEPARSLLDQRVVIQIRNPGERVAYNAASAAYVSSTAGAVPSVPSEFPIPPAAFIGPPDSGASLPRPHAALTRRVGTDEILGRTVEVIEYPDPSGSEGVRVREWRDPTSGLVLRSVQDDPIGRLTYRAEVVRFELNLNLDPDLFRFQPDPEDIEADVGLNCGDGSAGLVEDGNLRRVSSFLEPSYLPAAWQDGRWGALGSRAACPFARFWTILERHEDNGYIFFDQRRRAADDVPEWLRTDTPVDAGGHEGYRLTEDAMEHLIWAQDGVVALLESDVLPFEELLRIAESSEVIR